MARTRDEWVQAMGEDVKLINYYLRLRREDEEPTALSFAMALKEARRLQSDIYRYAHDIYGISKEDIDAERPL
jgi:hypothetical protein